MERITTFTATTLTKPSVKTLGYCPNYNFRYRCINLKKRSVSRTG